MADQENEILSYGQDLNFADIVGAGELVPEGRFRCRLQSVSAKDSAAGKPMVQVTWDIRAGDREGLELNQYFTMYASRNPKTQRIFAPGLAEQKEIFRRCGVAAPPTLNNDAQANAKLFATLMHPSKVGDVEVLVKHEDRRHTKSEQKDGKPEYVLDDNGNRVKSVRIVVVGRWKDSSSAATAVGESITQQDPLAGLGLGAVR